MGKRKSDVLEQELSWEPESNTEPLAVYFSTMLASNLKQGSPWKMFSKEGRRRLPILATRVGDVEFRGSAMFGQPNRAAFCQYALAVRDKRTGQITYSRLNGGRVWRLEPHLQQTEEEEPRQATQHPEQADLDYQRLVNTFGSQRQKRRLQAREAAKVTAENVSSVKEVERLFKSIQAQAVASNTTKDDVLKEAHAYRNIPPHHPEATCASDAYRLEELLPEEVRMELDTGRLRKALHDAEYLQEALRKRKLVSNYVADVLAQKSGGGPPADDWLEALAFLDVLLRLYHAANDVTLSLQMGSKSRLSSRLHLSDDCLPALLSPFYTAGADSAGGVTYVRSSTQRQLLMLTALVVALIADGFSLPPRHVEALRLEMGTTTDQLLTLFRELGCTVLPISPAGKSSKSKQYQVALNIPSGKGGVKTLADAFPKLKVSRNRGPRS